MNDTLESENSEVLESSILSISQSLSAMTLDQNLSNVSFENASYVKTYLRFKPDESTENKTYTLLNPTTIIAKYSLGNVSKAKKIKSKFCLTPTVSKKIKFTKIFPAEATQEEVFEQTTKSEVENFLTGKNCTVMTYGTTNSGKTFTLFGAISEPGIVPRSIDLIFSSIKCTNKPIFKPLNASEIEVFDENEFRKNLRKISVLQDSRKMHSVWMSFFEIYNEVVYDLLTEDWNGKRKKMKLVTDKDGTTFVNSLNTVHVSSALEAHQLLQATLPKLTVASTSLNPCSSRSHVVVLIRLVKYFAGCAMTDVEINTMTFYDLAGSGRLLQALNNEQRLTETRNINRSLLSLGKCFKIMGGNQSKSSSELIGPMRESCLTRLFQKTLCVQEPLTLLIHLSTSPDLKTETQNVLNVVGSVNKMDNERIGIVRKSPGTAFTAPVSRATSDWDLRSSSTQTFGVMECETLRKQNTILAKEVENLKTEMFDRECEIRREFAEMYSNMLKRHDNEWTKRIEEIENERAEFIKNSIRQIEDSYEENRGNSSARKRRKITDPEDDSSFIIQDLETKNHQLLSKLQSMELLIKKLRLERGEVTSQKHECAFQLALTSKELKLIKQTQFEENGVGNHRISLRKSESQPIKTQNYELETEVDQLQHSLLQKNNELSELRSTLEKSEETRKSLSQHLTKLKSALHRQRIDEGSLIRSLGEDIGSSPKVLARVPREKLPDFVDGSNRWSILEASVQSSDNDSKNDSGITTVSDVSKSSSDVQRRVEELKDDYKALKSHHEESTRLVSELSEELDSIKHMMDSLKFNAAENERKMADLEKELFLKDREINALKEDKRQLEERCSQLKDDAKLKSQEYLTVLQELNETLKAREENESRKSKFIEDYLDKTISLGSQLSSAHTKLEKTAMLCYMQHVPKIAALERELSNKSRHIEELGGEMVEVKKDLREMNELSLRVQEFEEVLERMKLEREDLVLSLQEKSENQRVLEETLGSLTVLIDDSKKEIVNLQTEVRSANENNCENNERVKVLTEELEKAAEMVENVKRELVKSEITRENLEKTLRQELGNFKTRLSIPEHNIAFVNFIQEQNKCKQQELDELKVQLKEKEQEIDVIRRKGDFTVTWCKSQKTQIEDEKMEEISHNDEESLLDTFQNESSIQKAVEETHSSTNCSESISIEEISSRSSENFESPETFLYSALSTQESKTSLSHSSSSNSMKNEENSEFCSSEDLQVDSKGFCLTQ